MCSFCNTYPETYIHLFWECTFVQKCWVGLIDFCKEYICTVEDDMSQENCLLSNYNQDILVLITVCFKRFVFICKLEEKIPSFRGFMFSLKHLRDLDFKRFKYARNIVKYHKIWNVLDHDGVFPV